MLTITIPKAKLLDDETQEFIYIEERTIKMEHSLLSISKWEAKWHKPFLSKEPMTDEQLIYYLKCMTITQNVPDNTYLYMPENVVNQIIAYINDPMTATKVPELPQKSGPRETPTSELIYYWMIELGIPWEAQTWHIKRLLTLIDVTNFKRTPPKQMSRSEIIRRNRELNAARRKTWNTKG